MILYNFLPSRVRNWAEPFCLQVISLRHVYSGYVSGCTDQRILPRIAQDIRSEPCPSPERSIDVDGIGHELCNRIVHSDALG